jgi:hypothetical protein
LHLGRGVWGPSLGKGQRWFANRSCDARGCLVAGEAEGMPVDLVGALVGWLVSLVGDAGIRLVRRSSDERALRQAITLAIDKVVKQADPSSSELLYLGLRECFSGPPQLGLRILKMLNVN